MKRSVAILLLTAVASTPLVGLVQAQTTPPVVQDALRAFAIVPPGQHGEVTAQELITGDYGPHYSDQLQMYADLVKDDDVTDEDLSRLFHSMQFGPGATPEGDPYSPTEGSTVYRDAMGIPHIYADDLDKASFALGYVSAEDRMWQMDVFRHAARGTLSEFVGAGTDDEYFEMDLVQRREGYTEDEVRNMYDQWDDKFGALGDQLQSGLRQYAAGINQYISELQQNPQNCSAEYQATGNPCPGDNPEEWSVADTLFLVILQLRIFGETGGGELENAGFYAHLQKHLGKKLGLRVYNDFLFQNDRKSPTTVPASQGRFPSQNLGKINRKSFAVPDQAAEEAQEQQQEQQQRMDTLRSLGFPTGPMSNAMIVSGAKSRSGNPLQWGAPQVGYANPAFFMDIDVHVPSSNVHYRGPAVPAASVLIPLGRGADFAWTLTTGYSDAVDTKVEKLCNPDGGKVAPDSEHYLYKGKCRKMQSRTETFDIAPTLPPSDPQPGRTEERTFYRTVHGPVFERGAVNGQPVAFVKDRYFWKQELDSVAAFYKWNTRIRDVGDFRKAASEFSMNFNAFYADAKDIGWFHVGYLPTRPKGMHPSLPTWGTGKWEFGKRFPFRKHPQAVNPDQGWIANWNNKPSVGWNNTDQCCYGGRKWGSVQRVSLLQDQMKDLFANSGKVDMSDLVDVARYAATQDARGVYLGRKLTRMAKGAGPEDKQEQLAAGLKVINDWISAGAHRHNRDDNPDAMDNSPALVLFDEWWNQLIPRIYNDELGEKGFEILGVAWTDYWPNTSNSGNFFFDASSYVKNVFDSKAKQRLARDYCDDMKTKSKESCKKLVGEALVAAYDKLVAEQGADMNAWTAPPENIVFQELGAGSADAIPMQNRGTHNHIVEILEDLNLPPFVGPKPSPSGSASPTSSPSSSESP